MLTREVFMLKKTDLDNRMHQTKVDERKKIAAVNEEYEQRMKDEYLAYRAKRNTLIAERDMKRLEIENKYKTERRNIWAEDCELVQHWRSQVGITPPNSTDGDGQHNDGE